MSTIDPEVAQAVKDLQHMISQLPQNPDLRLAMKELNQALLRNPAACALLLPEDIGAAVSQLYKLTGQEVAAAAEPKKRVAKEKINLAELTPEALMNMDID